MSQDTIPISRGAEPSSTRLVATLAIAGFLSGLIIVTTYEATLPRIEAHKAQVLREAVFQVLPGVHSMERLVYVDGKLQPRDTQSKGEEAVFAGFDGDGALLGYAIPGEGPGFQDIIALIYGYQPTRRQITGMEILESRETPGLGDKIYKDLAFVANFDALSIDPEIIPVKKGTKSASNEVDAITGATISSKAVVRIINETNARWIERLPQSLPAPGPTRPRVPNTGP